MWVRERRTYPRAARPPGFNSRNSEKTLVRCTAPQAKPQLFPVKINSYSGNKASTGGLELVPLSSTIGGVNNKQRVTLADIYTTPVKADIRWSDIESLFRAPGARVEAKGTIFRSPPLDLSECPCAPAYRRARWPLFEGM